MRWIRSRYGSLMLFGAVWLAAGFLLRTALLVREWHEVDRRVGVLATTYGLGLAMDVVAWATLMVPVVPLLMFSTDRFYARRWVRRISFAAYAVAVFGVVYDLPVEWFFWDEFGSRYNFFAVDYLVYTQEVFGNIWQSYPVVLVSIGIVVVAALVVWRTARLFRASYESASRWRVRLGAGLLLLVPAAFTPFILFGQELQVGDSHYNGELAKNGLLSFAQAFFQNNIDYEQYYSTRDERAAFTRLRELLAEPNTRFVSDDVFDIRREVRGVGEEQRLNVIVVVVESLSTDYLGCFGNDANLTPNLDRLADESLVFRNLYAAGTRTVRGLEALSLSLPPTPGGSVIKQPGQKPMFSAGELFGRKGYEGKFIYAGYGYFDNMNSFFEANGCRSVDRSDFSDREITFSNAWGVCDGDLYRRVLAECDQSHQAGKPFFTLAMTTSNHRPYTYPEGLIDIKPGGRAGAVKYTDYAIGQFLESARERPWFGETIFLIVADHCASSAGRMAIPLRKYHIPAFVYSPGRVKPVRYEELVSQIDLMPTLLGLMNWSYQTEFFGKDVLRRPPGRALLGTYQKLALFTGERMAILLPGKKSETYRCRGEESKRTEDDPALIDDAITYYQAASYLLRHRHDR